MVSQPCPLLCPVCEARLGTALPQPQPQHVQVELVRLPKPLAGPLAGARPMFNLVRQAAPHTGPAAAASRPMRLLLVQKGMEWR